MTGDRYMKYPLMALFFWFHQTLISQRHQVSLHPCYLLLGHAPALNVDRDARQMRRGGFALLRCGVAVVTAKFFLYLDCSYR